MDFKNLIRGCINGDRTCQKLLYDEYYSYGLKIVLAYSNSIEDAREILNDAFLKTFQALKSYNTSKPFTTWFRVIVVRSAINHYQRNINKINPIALDESMNEIGEDTLAHFEDLSSEEVLQLTQQLPPAYRMVLNLYALEGFSHNEIAENLGITIGTSKSNLSKARAKLRQLIEKARFLVL